MDKRRSAFHAQSIFFARMEVFPFVFVLSMVLRLDAEHIENKPNVGRLLFQSLLKERKKGDIFQPTETT